MSQSDFEFVAPCSESVLGRLYTRHGIIDGFVSTVNLLKTSDRMAVKSANCCVQVAPLTCPPLWHAARPRLTSIQVRVIAKTGSAVFGRMRVDALGGHG